MTGDPILQEIWAARDALAKQAGHDQNRFFEQLKARERTSGRKAYRSIKEALADYPSIPAGEVLEVAEGEA